jgi:predicted dehydrogenase
MGEMISLTTVFPANVHKLTSVLIGCGGIARSHLAAISELPRVEIAAVCDLSAARAEATAERFGISRWYSSYQKLLIDVKPNLVHITTTPSSHFQITKACLSAGLNVLCEKPITTNYQEFQEIKRIAAGNGCLLIENQNFRFHSSVRRICNLLRSGQLGDVVALHIALAIDLVTPSSPYTDRNVPHYSLALRGGAIGDFLTHIAYLTHMFTGSMTDLRATWTKRAGGSPLPADEFHALVKGERATAHVSVNGNAKPYGFWIRVTGTLMYAEANLFESPRLTVRKPRGGELAISTLIDGAVESRDVLRDSVAGLWRKLGGTNSYDGLALLVAQTYDAIESQGAPPISLVEIDEAARIVDRFTDERFKL